MCVFLFSSKIFSKDINLVNIHFKTMDRSVNIFDKIGSLIPGYSGYAERNNRRQCDKILREKISVGVSSSERLLSKRIGMAIKSNETLQITDIEECRKKINTICSKIKYSPYGESAFFSNTQLKEEELLKIYQKDLALLDDVGEINRLIPDSDVKTILKKIEDIEWMIKERNEFIKEFK